MKKLFILLALVFLISGCTTIDYDNLDEVVNEMLINDTELRNQNYEGYQYYLPREMTVIDKDDYNTVLSYKNSKMYLYVDIISYYHKVETKYEEDKTAYFSKTLDYNGKKGYITITKEDDEYYLEMAYNYGKIEAYTNEKNLTDTVINACYILRTLKYNDIIIESLIGENIIEYKEEKFDLFESDSSNSNYLDAVDDGDNYGKEDDKGEILLDDDSIKLEDSDDLNN